MKKKTKKRLIKVSVTIIVCYFISILITNFLFTSVLVNGLSMSPTLTGNEYALTDRFFHKFTGIKRFDIVIVDNSTYGRLIKRVIGKPGEKLKYQDGVLYINDKAVAENFLSNENKLMTGNISEITIPKGEYYILGDNRNNSIDSRTIGVIKKNQIYSSGIIKVGSCSQIVGTSCKGRKYSWPKIIK